MHTVATNFVFLKLMSFPVSCNANIALQPPILALRTKKKPAAFEKEKTQLFQSPTKMFLENKKKTALKIAPDFIGNFNFSSLKIETDGSKIKDLLWAFQ